MNMGLNPPQNKAPWERELEVYKNYAEHFYIEIPINLSKSWSSWGQDICFKLPRIPHWVGCVMGQFGYAGLHVSEFSLSWSGGPQERFLWDLDGRGKERAIWWVTRVAGLLCWDEAAGGSVIRPPSLGFSPPPLLLGRVCVFSSCWRALASVGKPCNQGQS